MPPRKTAAGVSKATATKAAAPKKAAATAKKPAATKNAAKEEKEVKKPAAKAKAKTAATSKKTDKVYDTLPDDEEDADAVPAKAAVPKATKASAKPKAPAAKATKPAAKTNGTKRKASESEEKEDELEEVAEKKPAKKAKTEVTAKPAKVVPKGPSIVNVPDRRLDIFVFGEGSQGELGLGSRKFNGKKPLEVKRPRINHNLDAETVGVVQVACGGMHAVALTHDNQILTWGVNDDRALGRDTTWTRPDDESDDEDESGLNPVESTPGAVNMSAFPAGLKIARVDATDSACFALTEDGHVYGWGTFRGSDGIIGFNPTTRLQSTPVLVEGLSKIKKISCGANHVLALDTSGRVWSFGSGGQGQLARKPRARGKGFLDLLKPEPVGKFNKKHYALDIAAGSYHSFYRDNTDEVWGWGLNNYSQTGHNDGSGTTDAMVLVPRVIESLSDYKVASIAGGEHHTAIRTAEGDLLTWGRIDGHQVGQPAEAYTEENTHYDENGRPRILLLPTKINDVKVQLVTAGTDTSLAVSPDGKAYSWGFSANYQTGQGTTEDIEIPTLIDNSAVRDRNIIWAGARGQYGMLAATRGDDKTGVVDDYQPVKTE